MVPKQYKFYRALTYESFQRYARRGAPINRCWAGHQVGDTGFRIRNRIMNWVKNDKAGEHGKYEKVVSVIGTLDEFCEDGVEKGVYHNLVRITIDRIIEEKPEDYI